MAQYGRSRKYAAATLICVLLQTLGTNAAPLDNANRGGPYDGHTEGDWGESSKQWDYRGQPGSNSAAHYLSSCSTTTTSSIRSPTSSLSTPLTVSTLAAVANAVTRSSSSDSLASSTSPAAVNAVSPGIFAQLPSNSSTTSTPVSGSISASEASSSAGATTLRSTASGLNASAGIFAETLASSTITPTDSPSNTPATVGTVNTVLPTEGESSVLPFATSSIASPSATIAPTSLSSTAAAPSATPLTEGKNIFVEISKDAAPYMVGPKDGHPVPRTGINASPITPIPTNKFYAALFLGGQTDSVWTHPYSLRWAKGVNNIGSWGFAVSHIERSQVVYGDGNPASYFANPIGIDSLIFSAKELGSSTVLTTDNHKAFSVNANLAPAAGQSPLLTLPMVQGMGFVTGVYKSATPLIQSGVFFKSLSPLSVTGSTAKTVVTLQDGTQWVIYVLPTSGSAPEIILDNSQTVRISSGFTGIVQVAKLVEGAASEAVYDASAGVYASSGNIGASLTTASTIPVTGTSTASYSLSWEKQGLTSKTLLMFALPHHVQAFDGPSTSAKTSITLQTTTKGIATGVVADKWTMFEQLPASMGFAPWSPTTGSVDTLPDAAMSIINSAAQTELSEDIGAQTNLDSMYFSGKALAKFAAIVYVANDLAKNPGLAAAGLQKLKAAMTTFIQNKQQHPLAYDTVWGGIVSTAGYTDSGADFGNTNYNDHHFHYGYFVYTAAVIAHLDPSWVNENSATNKAWVNALVRDYANSITDDPYYPFSRNFDWFHGHSWAKGLFESGAGKDEESSSEDSFASYAIKMWGKASGDANMEARGNLMLAIQGRSFQNYFLMESTNKVQPPRFIDNKVTGILFESKVDHTTYFGTNIEYIEGIHMIPIMPNSGLTRKANFVKEEWTKYFDNGRVDQIASGWRGILYANLALIDAKSSWNFFSASSFNPAYLDGGASRTWYLAFSAALGGVS